ncbi:hypothetical protein AB836_01125 [Rickettsiales bacterium (ex Bugula neritina AB1)]|nr:hypothetical protein AB836_01125 [Rickettsiales bacterium (ex Bugula neritina AB1)]
MFRLFLLFFFSTETSNQLKVLRHLIPNNDNLIDINLTYNNSPIIKTSIVKKYLDNFKKLCNGGLSISFKTKYLKKLEVFIPKFLFLKKPYYKINKSIKEENKLKESINIKKIDYQQQIPEGVEFISCNVKNNILQNTTLKDNLFLDISSIFFQINTWYDCQKKNNNIKIQKFNFAYKDSKIIAVQVVFHNNTSEMFYIYYANNILYIINNDNNIIPGNVLSITNSLPAKNSKSLIGSKYGWRLHPVFNEWRMHDGLDIRLPYGENLYSLAPGVVKKVVKSNQSGYGRYIEIEHNSLYSTRYCHLSSIYVKENDKILSTNQCIGKIGHSGTATAAHLHLVYLYNNKTINPINNYLISNISIPNFMIPEIENIKKKCHIIFIRHLIKNMNKKNQNPITL